MSTGQGALHGLRILDVTQVMAGPFCAMQLSDMGADVIKVEPPAGDTTRHMSGGSGPGTAAFNAVNRGKRGIVLDLQSARGREALARLAQRSDVLIENYRPGVMARWGLDYPTLSREQPRLIYASISGYGQTGPHATRGGFDLIAQGVSGLMSVTGEPGGPPVKTGVPITDLGAGLFALAAILAALHHRERSGRGQYIDTSLLEAGIALSVWEAAQYFEEGVTPAPVGSAHRLLAPYQAIRCADGYITVGAGTDRLFGRLCALLDHPEWALDSRYASNVQRVRHREELAQAIEAITAARTRAVWLALLEAHGIPSGPINDYAAVFADPQVRAREMIVDIDDPDAGRLRALGSPIKMSETPPRPNRRAPQLGEHTHQVLREAGFSPMDIEALDTTRRADPAP